MRMRTGGPAALAAAGFVDEPVVLRCFFFDEVDFREGMVIAIES
jgi:hypothetical protein